MRVLGAVAVFFVTFAVVRTAAPRHREEPIVSVALESRKGALSRDAIEKQLDPRRFSAAARSEPAATSW